MGFEFRQIREKISLCNRVRDIDLVSKCMAIAYFNRNLFDFVEINRFLFCVSL